MGNIKFEWTAKSPDYPLSIISEKISATCLTIAEKSELFSTVLSARLLFLSREIWKFSLILSWFLSKSNFLALSALIFCLQFTKISLPHRSVQPISANNGISRTIAFTRFWPLYLCISSSIRVKTRGWIISFNKASLSESLKTTLASFLCSMFPLESKIPSPNSSVIFSFIFFYQAAHEQSCRR